MSDVSNADQQFLQGRMIFVHGAQIRPVEKHSIHGHNEVVSIQMVVSGDKVQSKRNLVRFKPFISASEPSVIRVGMKLLNALRHLGVKLFQDRVHFGQFVAHFTNRLFVFFCDRGFDSNDQFVLIGIGGHFQNLPLFCGQFDGRFHINTLSKQYGIVKVARYDLMRGGNGSH